MRVMLPLPTPLRIYLACILLPPWFMKLPETVWSAWPKHMFAIYTWPGRREKRLLRIEVCIAPAILREPCSILVEKTHRSISERHDAPVVSGRVLG